MLHVEDVGEADGGEERFDVRISEDCEGRHGCGVQDEVEVSEGETSSYKRRPGRSLRR